MKGKSLLALCLVLLLSCFSNSRFSQTETKASSSLPVHDLNTGMNYSTIQEAVDANETLNGDTIEVDSGVYYGSINVNKSLTLVGENENSTILDGNGTGTPIRYNMHAIISLDTDGISIMNFTVRNAGVNPIPNLDACISWFGQHNIDFENNILKNAGGGIVCGDGMSSIVINNNIICDTTGYAIDVGEIASQTNSNITISNNVIYNVTRLGAINIDGHTDNCTVSNNTLEDSWQGIDLGPNSVSLIPPENVTVSNNFITNCSSLGIVLMGGVCNSSILDNTVENCSDGIWLLNDDWATELAPYDNLIDGNVVSNSNYSNMLYWGQTDIGDTQASWTNVFRNNNLTNAQSCNLEVWGWNVGSFMQDIDSSNTANNQKIYYLTNLSNVEVDPSKLPDAGSLTLVNCTNVTVKDFDFFQDNGGLLLAGSTGCTLTNETIANNQHPHAVNAGGPAYVGLSLVYSTNNTIMDSTMCNNTCGVWLCWSNGNIFYDNAFINNNYQVLNGMTFPTSLSTCSWNNTAEGNYWSDYNGSDVQQDGIGDTPYIVNSSNIDYHPLLGEFNSFNITSQYTVQTVCNSTISDLQFNGTVIVFNASGVTGTTGFCRICIPTALINGTFTVFVNGTEIPYTLLPESNSTQSYLYFTYHHSTQEVIITPEFPSFLILPLMIMVTLLAVIVYKKKAMPYRRL